MKRNKNMALITLLICFLLIFLIVTAIRHITIYMVFSSGIMPFIIIGIVSLAIVFLYLRGLNQRR
ncbi:hypothetical protein [Bacillus sp. EAC]|uniref:hypothetical protein n=1 Tax=Bacillus sp. EAC TaxID=1978338 RepID=UPI000B42DD13|nr:hypothetical protein [Bacillus sp. EAC]